MNIDPAHIREDIDRLPRTVLVDPDDNSDLNGNYGIATLDANGSMGEIWNLGTSHYAEASRILDDEILSVGY